MNALENHSLFSQSSTVEQLLFAVFRRTIIATIDSLSSSVGRKRTEKDLLIVDTLANRKVAEHSRNRGVASINLNIRE